MKNTYLDNLSIGASELAKRSTLAFFVRGMASCGGFNVDSIICCFDLWN